MKLSKYEISLFREDAYWFVSSGRQGDIYKGVLFQPLPDNNRYIWHWVILTCRQAKWSLMRAAR